jgi:hypothetical protein
MFAVVRLGLWREVVNFLIWLTKVLRSRPYRDDNMMAGNETTAAL